MKDFLKKLANLDLVIFDLDGTLIDSNGVHNYLDIELARSLGEEKNSEDILLERDEFFKNNNTLSAWEYDFTDDKNTDGYKLVGIIDNSALDSGSKLSSTVVVNDSLFERFTDGADNIYDFAVGAIPQDKDALRSAVSYCYREDSPVRYQIQNSVTYELDSVNDVLKILSKYFFWIGVGFAAFAALMLANFIGTSISYKKQEIGILRAIGSRSNDVFRIFFAESFIIAMINFVLSAAGVFTATALINYLLRRNVGILITVLNFGMKIAEGTPNELKNRYSYDSLLSYMPQDAAFERALEGAGYSYGYDVSRRAYRIRVRDSLDAKQLMCRFDAETQDVELVKGTMDDVFLNVTGRDTVPAGEESDAK